MPAAGWVRIGILRPSTDLFLFQRVEERVVVDLLLVRGGVEDESGHVGLAVVVGVDLHHSESGSPSFGTKPASGPSMSNSVRLPSCSVGALTKSLIAEITSRMSAMVSMNAGSTLPKRAARSSSVTGSSAMSERIGISR